MRLLKFVRKVPRAVFNKLIKYRMLGPVKLERDGIDESELEKHIPELHKAADDYFIAQKNNFKEERKKPFLVDASTSRMLVKLGLIFSELEFSKNLIAVDFGCGLGWLSHYLNRMGFNTIGLDVSKTALELAYGQFEKYEFYNPLNNYHFLNYDGGPFPMGDCSVHYIISFDAFHHVPNQAKVLKEMYRILVPGGKLILSEPGTGHAVSEGTREEVRKYQVLERDTNILDFEAKALDAGFDEIYLKPFFLESELKIPRKEYHNFFKGYVKMEMIHALRNTMIVNPMFICKKAGDFKKSWTHKAKVESEPDFLTLKPGQTFDLKINIENTGQLALHSRQHPKGGYITIASRLYTKNHEFKEELGSRLLLSHDIPPGEKSAMNMTRIAPDEPGEYILKIEPVYEGFYWFSEKDNAPAEISLKVKK